MAEDLAAFVVLTGVEESNARAPFVVERVAVTVLRCCIHLYDLPEVREMCRLDHSSAKRPFPHVNHTFFSSAPISGHRCIC